MQNKALIIHNWRQSPPEERGTGTVRRGNRRSDMHEIDWIRDSRSFDQVAELYDAHRPSYPEQMIEDILSIASVPQDGKILEIGSGTGKATQQFARRGYAMLCIEPGEHLAALARRKLKAYPQVGFQNSTFEEWQAEDGSFDLAFSGQAFHWIAPELRYTKTARILKEPGHLALFWNWVLPDDNQLTRRLDEVYAQTVPELVSESSESHEEAIQRWSEEIETSLEFDLAAVRRYPWEQDYPTRQYLGLLNTYSDHLRLADERRQQLFEAIERGIDEAGGAIHKRYEAVVFVGRKR